MKFIKAHTTNYSSPRNANIDRIVIHFTGNDGVTAEKSAERLRDNADLGASAHYFIDSKEIVQSVSKRDRAFHTGDRDMDDRSIGIEMCCRKDALGKYYIPCAVVTKASALCRSLMGKYKIPAENVLRHYDVNGELCPEPFVSSPEQWDAFREAIVTPEDAVMSDCESVFPKAVLQRIFGKRKKRHIAPET